jgi:hypothetical protein
MRHDAKPTIPKSLERLLQAVNRRLRLQEGLQAGFIAFNSGLLATLLLLLSGRFYPLAWPLVLLALGLSLTLLGLGLTLAYVWLRPRSPAVMARLLDQRLKLEERLSTSLELALGRQQAPDPIIQLQRVDTLNRLRKFKPAQIFPIQWPWRWSIGAALLAIAIAASLILPNSQTQTLNRRAKTQEAIAKQKAQFEEIRADLLEDEALLETPQGQELVQTLEELIKSLEENNLSLEEAMAAVSQAEQKLAALQEVNAEQEATLNELAQTFNQFDSTADLAEALQQRELAQAAEALASAGANLTPDPQGLEAAQELASALQQAAQTAQEAGDEALAEALRQAAEALQQAATQGSQSGDLQAVQEALQQAAEALSEAGEQLAGQEALEEALGNIQEAREQLAEANGQATPGQEQAQGQGQGQGQGNELVEGEGTGGGSGREDPGPAADGVVAEQGTSNQMSTDNGPNEGRTREYESLYTPLHLGGEGGPIVKPEEQGAEGGIPIGRDAPIDPDQDPGPALTPYNQVYGHYSDAASQALDNSYIPLGMKGYIRNYFGALEPGQ